MAAHRAALLWAGFGSLAVLLYGMAKAQQDGPSIPMEYCASVNTGEIDAISSNFQSDGRCFNNCTSLHYALAIVQEKNCWCSNLIPNKADQKPLDQCQYPCPGYPSDYCGGDGVFGYMEVVDNKPSGTAPAGYGASTSPPASSATDSVTPTQPTVHTVTVGGTVRTVTANPTFTGDHDPSLSSTSRSNSGLPAGAIAGIVIGVIVGLAAFAALLWFLFVKRRKQNPEESGGLATPARGGGSPRALATPKSAEVSESRYAGADGESSSKRRSYLMPVDPRLDPYAKGIYVGDGNRSRESLASLQDNQDYSRPVFEAPRVLRATNPDPDDD
ncbi:hypothetical protein VTK56DRAFT_7513 [Thermocarpiscus australiensis]